MTKENLRRRIPSVESVLSSEAVRSLIAKFGRVPVKDALVGQLDAIRVSAEEPPDPQALVAALEGALQAQASASLRQVINGSGVIIHTNLGRSPVGRSLWSRAGELVTGYSNLEFDLEKGDRGSREEHVSTVASQLFGCEAAILTNNNAAATLLLLAAVASGREVIVSRGELVEIGGSFRVPEVIQQGGALLREVGTTNRTRASDYEAAVSRRTAALLRVHRSNFDIVGFTERPELSELVEVARKKKRPLLYDEGSGCVIDLSRFGFPAGRTIRQAIEAGVDALTCSTDKLIGATQGGLILGKREIIDRCRAHPLMRALRVGKETYAVVTETLRAFLRGTEEADIPIYRMLAAPMEELRARAARIAAACDAEIVESRAVLGGGTTPGETMPSISLRLKGAADRNAAGLLALSTPIVTRIHDGACLIDVRTLLPEEDEAVALMLASVR